MTTPRRSALSGLVLMLAASAGPLAGCDDSTRTGETPLDGPIADAAPVDARRPAEDGPPADAGPVDAQPSDGAVIDAALRPELDAAPDAAPDAEPLDPLTVPLADQSRWGPAARVHRLDVPPNPREARQAGCLVHGAGAGSKLYSLLLVAGGGLGSQVRPDGVGRIDLVILLRATGWAPGVPASALDAVDVEVLPGTQGPDLELLYRADGFVDGDPDQSPVTVFRGSGVDDGWLETDRVTFNLPLSLLGSPELPLRLDNTLMTGRIAAEGDGFRLTHGTLAGYLTLDTVFSLVSLLREQCSAEDAPSFCALIGGQLDEPDEVLLELVLDIIGGLEARVDGADARPCDPELADDCNAVGICLVAQAEPAVVEGVAERP